MKNKTKKTHKFHETYVCLLSLYLPFPPLLLALLLPDIFPDVPEDCAKLPELFFKRSGLIR